MFKHLSSLAASLGLIVLVGCASAQARPHGEAAENHPDRHHARAHDRAHDRAARPEQDRPHRPLAQRGGPGMHKPDQFAFRGPGPGGPGPRRQGPREMDDFRGGPPPRFAMRMPPPDFREHRRDRMDDRRGPVGPGPGGPPFAGDHRRGPGMGGPGFPGGPGMQPVPRFPDGHGMRPQGPQGQRGPGMNRPDGAPGREDMRDDRGPGGRPDMRGPDRPDQPQPPPRRDHRRAPEPQRGREPEMDGRPDQPPPPPRPDAAPGRGGNAEPR